MSPWVETIYMPTLLNLYFSMKVEYCLMKAIYLITPASVRIISIRLK